MHVIHTGEEIFELANKTELVCCFTILLLSCLLLESDLYMNIFQEKINVPIPLALFCNVNSCS